MLSSSDTGRPTDALERLAPLWLGVAVLTLNLLCVTFTRDVGRTAAVWPANALAYAVLLRRDARRWPALLGAVFAADALAGVLLRIDAIGSVGLAACNLLEVLIGVGAMRLEGGEVRISSRRRLLLFLGAACVAAPALSGLGAASVLSAGRGASFGADFLRWFAAHAFGMAVAAPALAVLTRENLRAFGQRLRRGAGVGSLVVLAISLVAVFGQNRYAYFFVIPPSLIYVAFELDLAGAALAMLAVTAIAVVLTVRGLGPASMIPGDLDEQLYVLQAFLATTTIAVMPVADALSKRRRLSEDLQTSLAEAEAARMAATEAERLSTLAAEIGGLGYWRFEPATGATLWSDQTFRIHGVRHDQFDQVRDDPYQLFHVDDRERVRGVMRWALETGKPFQMTARFVRLNDGAERIGVFKGEAERDADGAVRDLVGVIRDVTDAETARHRIEESEARYRMIAENATDIVSRTGVDGRLLYLSPSLTAVTGYRVEALLGHSLLPYIHPDDLAPSLETYRRIIGGERNEAPLLYRARHADGHWVWLESNPMLLRDAQGEPSEFVDVTRDVSARRNLEAQLEAARNAAEEAAAVKSSFLANMSHEIRTPLTAILGFTRLLADRGDLDEPARTCVERIGGAGQALLAIVNDILDFSALEAGRVEIKPAPTSPGDLIRQTLSLFSAQAHAKGLRLALDGDERLPASVLIDPDRLRQVLLNLIGNAVKFTEEGEVRVTCRWRAKSGRLELAVIDTGPGLTRSEQQKLFQRFSQVDGSTTRKHQGTGLGLAICKGLVEAMGGEIAVTSRKGQGARFRFWAPASRVEAAASAEGCAEDARLQGLRLLTLEPDAAARLRLRDMLELAGAEVTGAADMAEALEAAAVTPFDVILIAVAPGDPGDLDGAAAIRGRPGPNRDVPIYALAAAGTADAAADPALGFDGVLAAPYTHKDLITLVSGAAAPAFLEPSDVADAS